MFEFLFVLLFEIIRLDLKDPSLCIDIYHIILIMTFNESFLGHKTFLAIFMSLCNLCFRVRQLQSVGGSCRWFSHEVKQCFLMIKPRS